MKRKYIFKNSLSNAGILIILISVCICPELLYAQGDIEVERSQNVQTWIDNYSKTYNITKPVLEVIREEHNDFYGEFGDALTALDIYIKLSNAQDWQAFETFLLAAEGKMLDYFVDKGMLSSAFTTSLAVFAAAKTAMELFKTYVFDPYLMNDAVDRYYGMREIGNEPANAIAIIGAIGNIRQQLLAEFRKIHGDQVFKEIAPSGLDLLDRWEPRFQEFALAFFENAYAQRKFEEMKKEAEEKKQQLESEMPAMEALMRAILDDLVDLTETLTITPSGETTIEMTETIQFTVTATTYGGEEKDVTDDAMLESTFVADSPGAHTITAMYDGHTAYATVIVNERSGEVPMSLIISPGETKIGVSETVTFTATAVFENDSTVNVTQLATWEKGSNSFTASDEGETNITVTYMGLSASATIFVEETAQCDEQSEVFNEETGNCICKTAEGYELNEELGKCINIDEAIEEVTEEGDELCDEEALTASLARLDELVASGNRIAANYSATLNKFMKEVNDQNSNVCENTIIAAAYAGAEDQRAEYQILVDEVTSLSTDLILEGSLCPLEQIEIDVNSILQKVSQLGQPQGQIEDGIATMKNQLQIFGCDEQDVSDQGDTIADRTDPEVIQGGGTGAFEVCGDGIDNDGNGLIDDGCEDTGNFNVTIRVFDSGPEPDDIFGLSVIGQGNLGNTPEGGLRTYPLRLSPGSFVATLTVIQTTFGDGTYTIEILEGSQIIGGGSGFIAQGASESFSFTVSGKPDASVQTETLLPMLINSVREVQQTEESRY